MDNILILGGMSLAFIGLVKKASDRQDDRMRPETFINTPQRVPMMDDITLEARKMFLDIDGDEGGPPIHPGEPDGGQNNLVAEKTPSGRVFWVQNLPHKEKAAILLERMYRIGHELTKNCASNGIFPDLQKRYPLVTIKEAWPPAGQSSTSWTMSKVGISLCVRNPNSELHAFNDVAYPFIHEVAHVACNLMDHVEIFWVIFRVLQVIARANGFWDPGTSIGFSYCRSGMNVSHKFPELYPIESAEYQEMIRDMQNNRPNCEPPMDLWKTQRSSNGLIAAIMAKIPENDVG